MNNKELIKAGRAYEVWHLLTDVEKNAELKKYGIKGHYPIKPEDAKKIIKQYVPFKLPLMK